MSTVNLNAAELVSATNSPFEEAHMAAAAFLARYSGRTLETYRFDLRSYFEWCAGVGLAVLEAKRAHIELWRAASEQRGLAASTIDRRLSTICGYYRFAHIDGRISANPAQYVRRPKVHPSEGRGLDRGELGTFLFTAERYDRDHAALAVLLGLNGLRVSEACATNAEDLGFDRGHRTLRIIGKGNKPAVIPLVPRVARTIDLVLGERCEGPILHRRDGERLDRRTAHRWVRSIGKRTGLGIVHPHMLRAAFIMAASTPECRCATSSSPPATPTRGPRPSTTAGGRTSTAMLPMSSSPSCPEGRSQRLSRAHTVKGCLQSRASGTGQPASTTLPAAAMLEEEAINSVVRRSFDLSIEVLLVPVLWRKRIEVVVIARKGVPDVGPRTEGRPLVKGELAGPTDSGAADNGRMRCGLLGDVLCELLVVRGEGEEAHDGVFQFASISLFLALAGLGAEGTFGLSAFGSRFGAHLSVRNRLARCPQSEEPTVLAMPTSRLPRQPVGARCLDGPGQEGIARGQELPVSRDLDISMLGVPRAILGCVDVEMLDCESFGIGRGFRIVHT